MSSYNRRIQLRRDSLANFTTHGPVLASGEPAIAFRPTRNDNTNSIDQPLLKVGNNGSTFVNLPQFLTNNDVDVFKYSISHTDIISAHTSATITLAEKSHTFLNNGDEYAVFVAPATALPTNVDISYGYYDASSTGSEISIVLHNNGTSDIFSVNADIYVMVVQAVQSASIVTTTPAPAIQLAHREMFLAGRNMHGQLGLDDNEDKIQLTRLYPYVATYWKQADAGYDHTVAMSNDDELYIAGSNYYGQLGIDQGSDHKRDQFTKVSNVYTASGLYDDTTYFNKISAGSFHTAAINTSGELFVCGNNAYGALGDGTVINSNKLSLLGDDTKYRALNLGADITHDGFGNVSLVDASETYDGPKAYIVQESGTYTIQSTTYPVAFVCSGLAECEDTNPLDPETLTYTGATTHSTSTVDGNSYDFFTGSITIEYNGCPLPSTGVKIAIKDGSDIIEDQFLFDKNLNGGWTDVSCGQYHTLGIKDQEVYAWGHNYFGQAAGGLQQVLLTPNKNLNSPKANRVVAGEYHSIVLESGVGVAGRAWSFGLNDKGQLGYGDLNNRNTFNATAEALAAPFVGFLDVVEAAAGKRHTLLVDSDNKLYVMGDNTHGQLGIEPNYATIPENTMSTAQKVAAGSNHSVVLDTFYRLQAMGLNHDGQLGLNDNENKTSLTIINNQEDYLTSSLDTYRFDNPAAGGNHTIAFRFDYTPSVISNIQVTVNANYRVKPSDNSIVQDRVQLTWDHPGLEEAVTVYRMAIWKRTSTTQVPSEPRSTSIGSTDNGYELDSHYVHTPTTDELEDGTFTKGVATDDTTYIYLDEPSSPGDIEYLIYIYGVNTTGNGAATSTPITVTKT
tara:strand:+ start:463 stop:3000 length:2538 start_codon:yes stop_codon:yes gene_type:complete